MATCLQGSSVTSWHTHPVVETTSGAYDWACPRKWHPWQRADAVESKVGQAKSGYGEDFRWWRFRTQRCSDNSAEQLAQIPFPCGSKRSCEPGDDQYVRHEDHSTASLASGAGPRRLLLRPRPRHRPALPSSCVPFSKITGQERRVPGEYQHGLTPHETTTTSTHARTS